MNPCPDAHLEARLARLDAKGILMMTKNRVQNILLILLGLTVSLWIGCDGDEESSSDNVELTEVASRAMVEARTRELSPAREGIEITQQSVQDYGLEVRAMTG